MELKNGIDDSFTYISIDEYTEDNFPEEMQAGVLSEAVLNFGKHFSSKEFDKITLQNE